MTAGVSDAVVVDVEAELLPHDNGSRYLRMVMKPREAELLHQRLAARSGAESYSLIFGQRVDAVRKACAEYIAHDRDFEHPGVLTDRAWAARSVLNILDGNIDAQIITETRQAGETP